MVKQVKIEVGGKTLFIETGKVARQADGAVTVTCGDTVVLVTAVSSASMREGIDFFPLTVDYRENSYAAGRFPGGYIKREGRPTEKEILTARFTDRPIRPLFPEGYFYEVQVVGAVLSADSENNPDVLTVIGASAALTISDIPFAGPVGCVRVCRVGEEFIVNPTYSQVKDSDLELVIAGTSGAVMMVEGGSQEVSEEDLLKAISIGHEQIRAICKAQENLAKELGVRKRDVELLRINEDIYNGIKKSVSKDIREAIFIKSKKDREKALNELFAAAVEPLKEKYPDAKELEYTMAFKKIQKEVMRKIILDEGLRADGRKLKDIRAITCETGLMPRTHGSALFTRGETQSLAITTLGTAEDVQKYEGFEGDKEKTFMLHYNFPPFSTGECRPMRGPGRREIGHGHLAERSIASVLPENYPYTIRIVSDILESNGSSSMATVCASSLSMMDAGVPVKAPLAGIAMGLIKEDDKEAVLSDILGLEDFLGDMDFKVAGTEKGITGFQMDIKVQGISEDTMRAALNQAREGRLKILSEMNKCISKPKEDISEYAPRIETITIDTDKIGLVIGPGGKTIKEIIKETGAEININDSGVVQIASSDKQSIAKAVDWIEKLTAEIEIGKIYKTIVKDIRDFGCIVDILPGKDGLVHISRLADYRVKKVSDICKVGDEMYVKVMEKDEKGRFVLSRKDALKELKDKKESE
ncbi:MAG: polyribonucleotide nucleotidyltransferase [Candidatus Aureabacteria bacterium]|nr:polyribonucleotide nucleotidyltransferase [Candidatus Auribacterota bacterium]